MGVVYAGGALQPTLWFTITSILLSILLIICLTSVLYINCRRKNKLVHANGLYTSLLGTFICIYVIWVSSAVIFAYIQQQYLVTVYSWWNIGWEITSSFNEHLQLNEKYMFPIPLVLPWPTYHTIQVLPSSPVLSSLPSPSLYYALDAVVLVCLLVVICVAVQVVRLYRVFNYYQASSSYQVYEYERVRETLDNDTIKLSITSNQHVQTTNPAMPTSSLGFSASFTNGNPSGSLEDTHSISESFVKTQSYSQHLNTNNTMTIISPNSVNNSSLPNSGSFNTNTQVLSPKMMNYDMSTPNIVSMAAPPPSPHLLSSAFVSSAFNNHTLHAQSLSHTNSNNSNHNNQNNNLKSQFSPTLLTGPMNVQQSKSFVDNQGNLSFTTTMTSRPHHQSVSLSSSGVSTKNKFDNVTITTTFSQSTLQVIARSRSNTPSRSRNTSRHGSRNASRHGSRAPSPHRDRTLDNHSIQSKNEPECGSTNTVASSETGFGRGRIRANRSATNLAALDADNDIINNSSTTITTINTAATTTTPSSAIATDSSSVLSSSSYSNSTFIGSGQLNIPDRMKHTHNQHQHQHQQDSSHKQLARSRSNSAHKISHNPHQTRGTSRSREPSLSRQPSQDDFETYYGGGIKQPHTTRTLHSSRLHSAVSPSSSSSSSQTVVIPTKPRRITCSEGHMCVYLLIITTLIAIVIATVVVTDVASWPHDYTRQAMVKIQPTNITDITFAGIDVNLDEFDIEWHDILLSSPQQHTYLSSSISSSLSTLASPSSWPLLYALSSRSHQNEPLPLILLISLSINAITLLSLVWLLRGLHDPYAISVRNKLFVYSNTVAVSIEVLVYVLLMLNKYNWDLSDTIPRVLHANTVEVMLCTCTYTFVFSLAYICIFTYYTYHLNRTHSNVLWSSLKNLNQPSSTMSDMIGIKWFSLYLESKQHINQEKHSLPMYMNVSSPGYIHVSSANVSAWLSIELFRDFAFHLLSISSHNRCYKDLPSTNDQNSSKTSTSVSNPSSLHRLSSLMSTKLPTSQLLSTPSYNFLPVKDPLDNHILKDVFSSHNAEFDEFLRNRLTAEQDGLVHATTNNTTQVTNDAVHHSVGINDSSLLQPLVSQPDLYIPMTNQHHEELNNHVSFANNECVLCGSIKTGFVRPLLGAAISVWSKYIQDDAPNQVLSLSSACKQQVFHDIHFGSVTPHVFDSAQTEIYSQLNDIFPSFAKSAYMSRCRREISNQLLFRTIFKESKFIDDIDYDD